MLKNFCLTVYFINAGHGHSRCTAWCFEVSSKHSAISRKIAPKRTSHELYDLLILPLSMLIYSTFPEARSVALCSCRLSTNITFTSNAVGGRFGGGRGGRGHDALVGKCIKIKSGPYKGYRGRVKEVTGALVRVELDSLMKIVTGDSSYFYLSHDSCILKANMTTNTQLKEMILLTHLLLQHHSGNIFSTCQFNFAI